MWSDKLKIEKNDSSRYWRRQYHHTKIIDGGRESGRVVKERWCQRDEVECTIVIIFLFCSSVASIDSYFLLFYHAIFYGDSHCHSYSVIVLIIIIIIIIIIIMIIIAIITFMKMTIMICIIWNNAKLLLIICLPQQPLGPGRPLKISNLRP